MPKLCGEMEGGADLCDPPDLTEDMADPLIFPEDQPAPPPCHGRGAGDEPGNFTSSDFRRICGWGGGHPSVFPETSSPTTDAFEESLLGDETPTFMVFVVGGDSGPHADEPPEHAAPYEDSASSENVGTPDPTGKDYQDHPPGGMVPLNPMENWPEAHTPSDSPPPTPPGGFPVMEYVENETPGAAQAISGEGEGSVGSEIEQDEEDEDDTSIPKFGGDGIQLPTKFWPYGIKNNGRPVEYWVQQEWNNEPHTRVQCGGCWGFWWVDDHPYAMARKEQMKFFQGLQGYFSCSTCHGHKLGPLGKPFHFVGTAWHPEWKKTMVYLGSLHKRGTDDKGQVGTWAFNLPLFEFVYPDYESFLGDEDPHPPFNLVVMRRAETGWASEMARGRMMHTSKGEKRPRANAPSTKRKAHREGLEEIPEDQIKMLKIPRCLPHKRIQTMMACSSLKWGILMEGLMPLCSSHRQ